MEQLIIFLLFVLGAIISSVLQNKKKQAEAEQQRELEELTRGPRDPRHVSPPPAAWPQTAADWQEQLRRMLQGENAPPPPVIIKPVLVPPVPPTRARGPGQKSRPNLVSKPARNQPPPAPHTIPTAPPPRTDRPELSEGDLQFQTPLRTSATQYQRASNLHQAVQDRMRAIDRQTEVHREGIAGKTISRKPNAEFVKKLRNNPRALREAFLASVVFGRAKSLEQDPALPQP